MPGLDLWALVPAAGRGLRMGSATPKQYLPLAGRTVLQVTLAKLARIEGLAGTVLALAPDDPHFPQLQLLPAGLHRVAGGAERADSVLAGLHWLAAHRPHFERDTWVLVHDGARPCVAPQSLQALAERAARGRAAILACPVADTLKRQRGDAPPLTVDRAQLWQAHTPQLFPAALLRRALTEGLAAGAALTDEASAVERLGVDYELIGDSRQNLKITQPGDLALAEAILQLQQFKW